jgi:hypothetical protein
MKKIVIYISLWAGIFAVSCNKSTPEAPEGIPMSFGTAAVSRAVNLVDSENINQAGNQLTVYDLYTTSGQSVLYMDATTPVTCDGSGNWTYSPLKYWTETGTHAFTAYLSKQGEVKLDGTNASYPTVTYNQTDNTLSISPWGITPDNQFDFLYAYHSRNMGTEANAHNPVEFELNHLLCAVQFNVVNLYDVTTVLSVSNFTISGLSNTQQATLSLSDGNVSYECEQDEEGTGEIKVERTSSVNYNKAYNVFSGFGTVGDEGYLLMWPHEAGDIFNNLQVSFEQDGSSRSISLASAGTNNWSAGQKYVYNLYVKDDRINIQAEVRPWIIHDIDLD